MGWISDGSPIRFDNDGNLIDGQHRLEAISQLQLTVQMVVVRGVNDDRTIDTDSKRTLPQYLAGHGEINTNGLAASIRLINKYRLGVMHDGGESSFPNIELLQLFNKEPTIRESHQFCVQHKWRGMTSTLLTLLHYIVCSQGGSQERVEEFIIKLEEGTSLEANNPIFLLRERILRKSSAKSKWFSGRESTALLIKAWNKWSANQPVSNLQWRSAGPNAEDFPTIVPIPPT
jgi:hypothetical protein